MFGKSLVRLFAVVLVALSLVACGKKLTQENFNKINNGMSHAEVVKVLGEPASSQGGGMLGITASTSVWRENNTEVTVIFVNDKVTSKVLNERPPQATAQ